MKTLTDLFQLILIETELNKGKVLEYLFDIDTKYKWVSMTRRTTLYNVETDENEITDEEVFSHLSFEKEAQLQQVYWTIYNEGRQGR